jgi:hypothetical protein
MVFDDHGFLDVKAFTRFCAKLRENATLCFVHDLNGHAIFYYRVCL